MLVLRLRSLKATAGCAGLHKKGTIFRATAVVELLNLLLIPPCMLYSQHRFTSDAAQTLLPSQSSTEALPSSRLALALLAEFFIPYPGVSGPRKKNDQADARPAAAELTRARDTAMVYRAQDFLEFVPGTISHDFGLLLPRKNSCFCVLVWSRPTGPKTWNDFQRQQDADLQQLHIHTHFSGSQTSRTPLRLSHSAKADV